MCKQVDRSELLGSADSQNQNFPLSYISYSKGRSEGYEEGFNEGKKKGFDEGYTKGREETKGCEEMESSRKEKEQKESKVTVVFQTRNV